MKTLFTSDSHYNHKNIIRYCERPFLVHTDVDNAHGFDWNLDVAAMNEAMINNWNAVVAPGDHVFHLGDFAMGGNYLEEATAIRLRLNGTITLVRGNHDRSRTQMLACGFEEVVDSWDGTIEGSRVLMQHHPPARPEGKHGQYDLILCGHVHEAWLHKGKVVNVGVDKHNFTPWSLEDLLKVNT